MLRGALGADSLRPAARRPAVSTACPHRYDRSWPRVGGRPHTCPKMERTMPLAGQRAAAGEAAALPQWSNALRAIREARGVSQAGWAARLGRSRNTVQRWESGAAVPDQEAEQAIIDYCRGHALFDLPLY